MTKNSTTQAVRTLLKWHESGSMIMDSPIQRKAGQWSSLQKSLLIHSMLGDYIVPPIYFAKEKREGKVIYDLMEGKQRLTTVFDFLANEFQLHAATPDLEYHGLVYDLANKTFGELEPELQDAILGYRFSVTSIDGCTKEEKEETFIRLNNSSPLVQMQKNYSNMGTETARWLKTVLSKSFFTQSIHLTVAQFRKEADAEVLVQGMMLLEARDDNYEYKAISVSEVAKFSQYMKLHYDDNKRKAVEEVIDYLSEALPVLHKFLKKSNIPMVIVLGRLAVEQQILPEQFKLFLNDFHSSSCERYEENTGSNNTKYYKVTGRLDALCQAFVTYFRIEDFKPLTKEYQPETQEMEEVITQTSISTGKNDGVSDFAQEGEGEDTDGAGDAASAGSTA